MEKKSCGDDDDLPLLPEDLFYKILVCLPVQSLLRFKSVCKSWGKLIESSFFIDLHTTTTTTTFNSSSSSSSKFVGTFILQTNEHSHEYAAIYDGKIIKMFMLSSSSGSDGDQKKMMVLKVDDLGFLPFYKDYLLTGTLRMVGSCNGIICLHDPQLLDYEKGCIKHHYSNLRDVSLWNPATRQFRILPKSIPIQEKQYYIGNFIEDFIAFGFDVKTKDYKVLRITTFTSWEEEKGGCMCRVQVYSLSTDSWRLLEGINYLPVVPNQGMLPNHGIYLNGSYFFVGTKIVFESCDAMMLSFDFTKEIFTTIQLPDDDKCSRHIFELVLSYLGEKLVVFITTSPIDIWVQSSSSGGGGVVNKEYSWTKLDICLEEAYTEPIRISYNGEFALISKKMELFNLVTKEAKKDFLIGTTECRADVYKESLVSIMGGNGNVLLRWQLPTHGTCYYKLNLDAPFVYSRPFGIGLCLTSDTGGCIGVKSLQRYDVRDAEKGEALAMLEAIRWVTKLELSPIIIESDSKNCVSFFMDDDDNNSIFWSSGALSLLVEAKLLLLNSSELGSSISFQYCSRSCNYVTDVAAKLGREGFWASCCKEWTANFPGEMVRSLSKDLGSETR